MLSSLRARLGAQRQQQQDLEAARMMMLLQCGSQCTYGPWLKMSWQRAAKRFWM
jgi:hypothetical protein